MLKRTMIKTVSTLFVLGAVLVALLAPAALNSLSVRTGRLVPIDAPVVRAVVLDPYQDNPLLVQYSRYRDALFAEDVAALKMLLSEATGSYLEYIVALTLARTASLEPAERVPYYERVTRLWIDDPLTRSEKQDLLLEYASTAEDAGYIELALDAYEKALPRADGVRGVQRLESDPIKLVTIMLGRRMYDEAIFTLDQAGLVRNDLRAKAYRGAFNNEHALDYYDAWLAEAPDNAEALLGKAWILYRLKRYDEADTLFADISQTYGMPESGDANYGRALIALKQDAFDVALTYYAQAGEASSMWEITNLLEERGQYAQALPIYLQLATLDTQYADDAAYRAYTLAQRLDDAESMALASEFIPNQSFFTLVVGNDVTLTLSPPTPPSDPEVIALARALVRVGDRESAIGELVVALQSAEEEADVVALGIELQRLGEFRQSSRAAEGMIRRGNINTAIWRLAYPRAYEHLVRYEAERRELEPTLLWGVMRTESRFYPRAVSHANAKGLMQFIPSTWSWMADLQGEVPPDPFVPAHNIRYGAYYLRWLLDYFDGDVERAVPAYNGGQGYIRRVFNASNTRDDYYRNIGKNETREYLQRVMLDKAIYEKLYTD